MCPLKRKSILCSFSHLRSVFPSDTFRNMFILLLQSPGQSLRLLQHSQGDPEVLGYFASNSLHKDDETDYIRSSCYKQSVVCATKRDQTMLQQASFFLPVFPCVLCTATARFKTNFPRTVPYPENEMLLPFTQVHKCYHERRLPQSFPETKRQDRLLLHLC